MCLPFPPDLSWHATRKICQALLSCLHNGVVKASGLQCNFLYKTRQSKNVRKLLPDVVHICYEDASGDCNLCVYLGRVCFLKTTVSSCGVKLQALSGLEKRLKHWTYTCTFVAFLNITLFFSSITTPQVERNCDWNAGGKCKLSGAGQRPFRNRWCVWVCVAVTTLAQSSS